MPEKMQNFARINVASPICEKCKRKMYQSNRGAANCECDNLIIRKRELTWAIKTTKSINRSINALCSQISNSYKYNPLWKKLRMITLVKYDFKCLKCGSEENVHVDHIKPVKLFPHLTLDKDNLQVLCKLCNINKRIKIADYRTS